MTGEDAAEGVPDGRESRRENFEIFDFDLGQPERDEIDLLPTDVRTANPPWAPDWNA